MKLKQFMVLAVAGGLVFTVSACGDDDGGCSDECATAGDTQCSGDYVQSCAEGADGCLAWTDGTNCATTGQTCDDSGAVAMCAGCTDNCTAAGDTQCASDWIQTCTLGASGCLDWEDTTDCTASMEVCDDLGTDAECVTDCATGPDAPTNPAPADSAADVDASTALLDWDDATGADSYDVYFGDSCPPPAYPNAAFQNVTVSELDVTLQGSTTYCWQAVSLDTDGCATEGPVWGFATLDGCTSDCTVLDDTRCTDATTLETCTQNGACLNWLPTDCSATGEECTGTPAACDSPAAPSILLMGEDVADSPDGWDTFRTALTTAGATWIELNLSADPFPVDATAIATYDVIIWFDEGTLSQSDSDCQVIADWLALGGKDLFATSVDWMWDLQNGGVGNGEHNLYLLSQTEYMADYAGTSIATIDGVTNDPITGSFVSPNGLTLSMSSDSNGDYADETAATLATIAGFYSTGDAGSGHGAISHYTDTTLGYQMVWLGVNFHNGLTDQAQRNVLMQNILTFFGSI